MLPYIQLTANQYRWNWIQGLQFQLFQKLSGISCSHMYVQLQKYQDGLLRGYSGCQLDVEGQVDVNVTYGRQNFTLPLVVMADHHRSAILGCN